jgi:UPF0716 protein FxsA
MALVLLGLLITLPIAELYVLLKLGSWIGVLPTIALLILKAFIGTALLRMQGLAAFNRGLKAVAEGRLPLETMIDGMGLMIAGALLVTPGLITDAIGLLLFIPQVRRWLFARLLSKANVRYEMHRTEMREEATASDAGRSTGDRADGNGPVIEGEFERIDERTLRPDAKDERRGGRGPSKSPWTS